MYRIVLVALLVLCHVCDPRAKAGKYTFMLYGLTIHSDHLFTELAFLPYVDLSSEDAGTLPKRDDGDSGAITLPSHLPFKQSNQTTAFVSVNESQLINR